MSWKPYDSKHVILGFDDSGLPFLLDTATAEPAVPATGLQITEGGDSWDNLHERVQEHITAQKPDSLTIESHDDHAVVVLRHGEETTALTVPVKDSPTEVVEEFSESIKPPRTGVPPGSDPVVFERRIDAVRDAARENDEWSAGDIREFLKGRAIDPSVVDHDAFLRDVRAQRIDDLIDILDHGLRSRVEGMMRSRRYVRIIAPKGWTDRVFRSLSDNELVNVLHRLERRGWERDDLVKHIVGRVKDEERRTTIEESLNG